MNPRRISTRRPLMTAVTITLLGGISQDADAGVPFLPIIEAILEASLNETGTPDGIANPGDTIDFTATITNTGNAGATDTVFDTALYPDTTLIPGSLKATPLALDDTYTAIGNVGLTVPAPGVLSNDLDPDGSLPATAVVSTGAIATSAAGTVTMSANGAFTYDPAPGFEGVDTFTYQIADSDGLGDASTGAGTVSVSITVEGAIWFVDSAAAGGGNGTLEAPFSSLTDYNASAPDEEGDCIYLAAGSYTGGIVLKNGQRLIGQGSSVDLPTFCSLAFPPHTPVLPATGGTRPILGSAGGDAISLASNNRIRGLDVGNTLPAFDSIAGASFGTLTVSEVAVTNTTGGGVDLNNGNLDVVLDSVTSDGSDNGIRLANTAGTFSVTGDGSTGTQGGNGSGGVISNTSGDGVSLSNAFGITLRNMTIGATSASPSDPPTDVAGIAGDGIGANFISGLTLANITIAETGAHGIDASGLSGLNLTASYVLNAGNGNGENGIHLRDLGGDNTVTGCLLNAFNETGLDLANTEGTTGLTITGTTFQNNKATIGNYGEEGILIKAQGSAEIVAHVTGNCIFNDINSQGVHGISEGESSSLHLTFQDSSINETNSGDGLVICNTDNGGNAKLLVIGSTLTDSTNGPFGVIAKNDSTGELHSTINNVTAPNIQILNHNHDDIGSGGDANGTSWVHLLNCTNVFGTENIGADFLSAEGVSDATFPDVHITAVNNTITAGDESAFTLAPAMRVDAQSSGGTAVHQVHIDIRDNVLTAAASSGANELVIAEFDASEIAIESLTGTATTFLDGLNTMNVGTLLQGGPVDTAGDADLPTLPNLP